MSNLDALFQQFGVKSSSTGSGDTAQNQQDNFDQQYIKLDSAESFQFNRQTRVLDLERSLFAKWSEEKDDEAEEPNAQNSDTDDSEEETCKPCSTFSSLPTQQRFKSTDNDLKRFAFDITRMGMASCNPTVCKLGGECVQNSTIADMRQMVKDFWGDFEDSAPSSKTRRLLILDILRSAFRPDSGEFHFYAGNKMKNNRRVCEAGYLILLGLSNNPNASAAPNQWSNAKKYIISGKDKAGIPYSTTKEELLLKAVTKSSKFRSAATFIEFFAKEFGDTIPGPEGGLDVYVAPFVDLKSFHNEYLYYHAHQQSRSEDIAKPSTFNSAFKMLHATKGIKLLKAKGAFQTCEICNNASELLMNKHRALKHSQREVIQKFRQLHLTQQAKEREFLDHRKLQAAKCDDAGNPLRLFLFSDGFTVYTCNTPRFSKESKGDKVIETRIVGTEVICGPIKTVLVYRTDAMVGGGANITIELIRQAIIDTSILLRKRGLLFPRTLWLQFDNCGDNKNQFFFMYSSLLIELFAFDEVEIAFLIVGHTHASIDQYFSVIAKAIRKAHFIGTPMALLELIRRCHESSWQQKAVIREIKVYYDLKSMFEPYRNKRIKYFGIPHIFRFTPSFGHVAIMEYKNFVRDRFMPPKPIAPISDMKSFQNNTGSESIFIPELAAVNGSSALTEFLGLGTSSTSTSNISTVAPRSMHDMLRNTEKIDLLKDVNSLLDDFEAISIRSIQQQEARMHDEAEGLPVQKFYHYRADMQRKMMNQNTSTEGYIIWLDLASRKDLAPLNELLPQPFDPADGLEQVEEFLSVLAKEDGDENFLHSGGPPFKRNKVSSSSKTDDKAAMLKRQVKAAKSIASTCQWVLKLLEVGRVRRTFGDEFEENHFYDTHLTNLEVKWLEDHCTTEKVLSIICMAYATAPKWEAFPKTTLAEEDLKRIEEEEAKHMRAVEEANSLGRSLLVRIGENAGDMQHVVEYGKGSALWIGGQLSKRRADNKKDSKNASQKASVRTSKRAVDDKRCGVEECTEAVVVGASCTNRECLSYSFCDLHVSHTSHGNHRLRRVLMRQDDEQQSITQIEDGPDTASSHKLGRKRKDRRESFVPSSAIESSSSTTAEAVPLEPGEIDTSCNSSASAPSNSSKGAAACNQQSVSSTLLNEINSRYKSGMNRDVSAAASVAVAVEVVAAAEETAPSTVLSPALQVAPSSPQASKALKNGQVRNSVDSSVFQGFSNENFEGMHNTTIALGKPIHELHLKIIAIVASEASKQKDFTGRLQRELNFSQYINPLAVLCIDVYQLDIPQLRTTEIEALTASSGLASDRDYKRLICGGRTSKFVVAAFLKSFVDAFVQKYCS